MIDTARIAHWAASTDSLPGEVSVPVDVHAMSELARDYLALREIVEALVIRPPFGVHISETGQTVWQCESCNVFAGTRQLFSDPERHEVDCAYALAVALVGPASARTDSNPLEFEWIGEEPV